jgi:predicted acylesterase/phospholipase RssA
MLVPESSRRLAIVAIAVVCIATPSCSLFRESSSVPKVRSAGTDALEAQQATVRRLVDLLAQRVRERRDAALDILLISSGGQQGAYAAGFLRGWQERTQPGMPHFDLVTGVSSGALLAPFALIGTQAAVDRGAALYRTAPLELAPSADFWSSLQSDSGGDATRYRDLVDSLLDSPLQAELHHEYLAKRTVAIATTDFDLGAMRFWELGHELGEDERGLKRARALIVASAAIPGVFTPAMIDRHVHGAGDVLSSLLVPLQYDDFRLLAAKLRATNITDIVEVRVWVIMNGFGTVLEERLDPESRTAMTERARSLVFRSMQSEAVERISDLTRAVSTGVRGLRMQLRVTMIPHELAEEPGADTVYDPAWMLRLEQIGYERARGESGWDRVIVPRDRYE